MLKTYIKGLLTFITLRRVDSKVFTQTTITMKARLHLHLPQACDWLIAFLRTPRSWWSTPLRGSPLNSVSKEYTYVWYSARPHKQPKSNIKSIFKFINHVRVQATLDREHGWSISFTLCRGCTLWPQFT
jgi:hypothetical protein